MGGVLELGLQLFGWMSQFEYRPLHIPPGGVVPFLRVGDAAEGAWVATLGLGTVALLKVNTAISYECSKGDPSTTTKQRWIPERFRASTNYNGGPSTTTKHRRIS